MCILFLYTNPEAEEGQFRLILATNRDESYKRPAKEAHFWDEDPTIIGGRDMEPGREGGTWFAMSRKGRIGTLLNAMGSGNVAPDAKSRGCLVGDYLSAECGVEQHLSSLEAVADQYSPFNLLAVDVRRDAIQVYQVSNVGDTRRMCESSGGFVGIGNHRLGCPTGKVSTGLSRFANVVGELGSVQHKDELLQQLLSLLKWDKRHYPDAVLESLAPSLPQERRKAISSVFISNPAFSYGTRTHTIVLIDSSDQVDFIEWTMAEPIQPDNPQWKKNHFIFQLNYEK